MKYILVPVLILFCAFYCSAQTLSPDFHLLVFKKDGQTIARKGDFIPNLQEPHKRKIHPADPGKAGHFTVLIKDAFVIQGRNDTLEQKLNAWGSYVYYFENTDMLDTSKYLPLIQDSTTVDRFLARVKKVKKREWELYRIVIRPRFENREGGKYYCFYLRFQGDLLTINLPDKSNREALRFKSISPTIPLIHLGDYDSSSYHVGPGISFNIGLAPRKPFLRLAADLLGPVSIEWMFFPIQNLHDALAVRSAAIGIFFNSGYGILHWGFAFYTLNYARGEAYIGINLVPVMSLWESRNKQRYRW
ncbi:MAG: hypothetical protein M3R17_18795 [Bacteroidota bacterium]|nr:hypothetical protein [Bacteroidota bacterium]